jgi:hypothetical protein
LYFDTRGVNGVGVFDASLEEPRQIMDGDPGVQAAVFTYEARERAP